jgi:hypothetical protein
VARADGYVNEERLSQDIELFDTHEPLFSSSAWQSAVHQLGHRAPDGRAVPPAALPYYLAPPTPFPHYWEAPSTSALAAIPALWADVKRPASILLLLDTSGSMSGRNLEAAKRAIREFLVYIVGARDRLGLMTFASVVNEVVPLQPAATAAAQIDASLGWVTATGQTVLFDSFETAIARLGEDGDQGLNAIVLLSDGADNGSDATLWSATARIRAAENLLIYAVSYPEGSPDTLRSLVAAGRGQVKESDPHSIVRVYEAISRRL